jgi:hypothetical protein
MALNRKKRKYSHTGVQSKNNVNHIVDKVQNSYENTLKFNLIDNVVYVVFELYSSIQSLDYSTPHTKFVEVFQGESLNPLENSWEILGSSRNWYITCLLHFSFF